MFSNIQTAAVAALFATSAFAYTPADYEPEAVLVTVTVTNTKTWCPCEKTGLSSWATWAASPASDPSGWEAWSTSVEGGKTTKTISSTSTTSYPWTSSTTTKSVPYGNYTTSSSSSTTSSSSSSSSGVTTTTTTSSASSTPTFPPKCNVVEWKPGQCQDNSYFKLGDHYLYQSCNRALIDNGNYLEDLIEIFCDVTSLFDDSIKATAWDPSTSRCYAYTDDDDLAPRTIAGSTALATGNVAYTIKFDSVPCAGFNSTGPLRF